MTLSIRQETAKINKMLQEASSLCDQGEWESALVLYQRGLSIRPASMACRAGAQRASYVIKNMIKGLEDADPKSLEKTNNITNEINDIHISNKFTNQQPKKSILKTSIVTDDKPFYGRGEQSEFKELSKDIQFIQQIKNTERFPKNSMMDKMLDHLDLLLKKSKIWSKQDKIYYKKKENIANEDPTERENWKKRLEDLETVTDPSELLILASNYLKDLDNAKVFYHNRILMKGQLYYLILKAHIDLGNFEKVSTFKEYVINVAKEMDDEELFIRASYLEGRAQALSGNYSAAALNWQKLLKLTTNYDRLAHLFHEIGRCYFKLNQMESAKAYGVMSLDAANKAKSDVWIKNAAILIAQIEGLRGSNLEAIQHYEIAESAARKLDDQRALIYIICESAKLGKTPRRPKIDETIMENFKTVGPRQYENDSESIVKLRRPKNMSPHSLTGLTKKAKIVSRTDIQNVNVNYES